MMNRLLKKSFALLLAACLPLALAVPALAGLDGNYTSPVPTVYLQGQGSTLSPLTVDSGKKTDARCFFTRILNIFRFIFNYLRQALCIKK